MKTVKPESEKYFEQRLCMGGDCTAKSQQFLFEGAAKEVASLFCQEQINKAIRKIQRLSINGIKGLVGKSDVIKIMNEIKKEKFLQD